MKQINRLKYSLLIALLLGSVLAIVNPILPDKVFAAGCDQTSVQTDCYQNYVDKCKKDYPQKKDLCEALTVDDINKCAVEGSGNRLKKNCLEKVEQDKSGISTDYNKDDCSDSYENLDGSNCGILRYILLITNVLSGIAGTVIVIMIIVGGIQYSASGADASKVQAAKQKIYNALIALLLFIFGFGIVQWLVPGGVF